MLVTAQAGLARRDQLRELGVSRGHVTAQCAAGRWRLVTPTVVSVDNGRLDEEQRRWAAVLNAGQAWIGGRAALMEHGLTGDRSRTSLDLLVPRGSRPTPMLGVHIHVTTRPPDAPGPRILPVTSVPRSTIDAAAWETSPRAASGLVVAVVQQRLASIESLAAELCAAGHVRHRTVVRDALDAASLGADSVSEEDVAALVRRAGLPTPRRQVRSRVGRHDLETELPDGRRLVIEVDGPQHETAEARWADARRDAAMAADGVIVLRVPVLAVRQDPDDVVTELRALADAARTRPEM